MRCELWGVYWIELENAKNNTPQKGKGKLSDEELEQEALKKVQEYIEGLHTVSKSASSEKNIKKLFRHLNFIDVIGTLYIYKKNGVLQKEEIKTLYAGRLKTYLEFYKTYFENRYQEKTKPNAMLLLMDLEKD